MCMSISMTTIAFIPSLLDPITWTLKPLSPVDDNLISMPVMMLQINVLLMPFQGSKAIFVRMIKRLMFSRLLDNNNFLMERASF